MSKSPDLIVEFVKCRAYKHAMDDDVPRNIIGDKVKLLRGFYDITRCMRCGVIRVTEMGFDGYAVRAPEYYDYPDGYEEVSSLTPGEAKVWLEKNRRKRAAESRIAVAGRGPSRRARSQRVAAVG